MRKPATLTAAPGSRRQRAPTQLPEGRNWHIGSIEALNMNDEHRIQATPEGYQCSSCRQPYPSLYWFKRETRTGEELCLGCASAFPSGTFEDVLPDPKSIENQQKQKWWQKSLIFLLAFAVSALHDRILSLLGINFDMGFWGSLLGLAGVLIAVILGRRIWRSAASSWRKGSNPLWRKP